MNLLEVLDALEAEPFVDDGPVLVEIKGESLKPIAKVEYDRDAKAFVITVEG